MMSRPAPHPSGPGSSAEMGIDPERQALSLLLSLAAGLMTGLFYDLLRPLRHRLRPGPAAMLDSFFAIGTMVLLFLLAMSAGGRLGTWELACELLGFLLWLHCLSSGFLRGWEAALTVILNMIASPKKVLLKVKNLKKNSSKNEKNALL